MHDAVTVRGLEYWVEAAAVMGERVIGGLPGMVDLAAEVLLGHVLLVDLVQEAHGSSETENRSCTGWSTSRHQP